MYIVTVPWDIRAIWAVLTIISKAYLVFLLIASIYMALALIRTKAAIHTVRQLHYACFLLFGVCLSDGCFASVRAVRHSMVSLSASGIEAFEPIIAFSFAVLTVLSFLQILQWIVSSRH